MRICGASLRASTSLLETSGFSGGFKRGHSSVQTSGFSGGLERGPQLFDLSAPIRRIEREMPQFQAWYFVSRLIMWFIVTSRGPS